MLDIKLKLESGLVFPITSLDNWNLVNEIFANNEYGGPVESVVSSCKTRREVCFVDLGANSGMFTLYLIHRLREAGFTGRISGLLVEPAGRCVGEIRKKVLPQVGSECELRIVQGAVGERTGRALLYLDAASLGNHLAASASKASCVIGKEAVEYIDLDRATEWLPVIDLVKCDVEGSEFSVARNYSAFLCRSSNVVVEAHKAYGDLDDLRDLIMRCGFSRWVIVKNRADSPIWWFSRS